MPLASEATLRCLACSTSTSYVELIVQIADKARERSHAMLEEIRRRQGSWRFAAARLRGRAVP